MKSASHFEKPLAFGILLLALITTILQTVAFLTSYDPSGANYFRPGAVLPSVSTALVLVGALAAILLAVFAKFETIGAGTPTANRVFLLTAVGFLSAGFLICFEDTRKVLLFGQNLPGWFLPLLFILSGIAFGLAASPASEKNKEYTALFLFIPVVCLIIINCVFYFDTTLEMNAPIKVSLIMALLCGMIYILGEIRYLLGNPFQKVYLMTTLWVVLSGSLSSIPMIIAFASGKYARMDLFACSVLSLCITATALIRLISFFRSLELTKAEEPEEDGEATNER